MKPVQRTTEKAFGFTYEGWDEGCSDYGDVQFYKVEFTEDFGPIKKGDKFDCVLVEHSNSRLVAMTNNDEGEQIGEVVVNWKAVPTQ